MYDLDPSGWALFLGEDFWGRLEKQILGGRGKKHTNVILATVDDQERGLPLEKNWTSMTWT